MGAEIVPDSTNPPAPQRFPVLVVEDDAAIRKMISRTLSSREYTVTTASSMEEALHALKDLATPILVVDQNLAGGPSGIDLVETMRNVRSDFEAILVTAHADVDSLTRSLRLGFFRCVLKPFRSEDLVAAVEGAANRLFLRLDLRARKKELEARNTELEELVRELRALQEQRLLGERLASIGRLAAGVAHEINTPLSSVTANLALIAEELQRWGTSVPGVDIVSEMLTDAREASERVRVIVRDLRTFSRAEAEHVGAVDLQRTIEASINMVYNEIRHRARLVKDYGPTADVEANAARVGQVVLNLLLNAAQAIPEGDVSRHEIRIVTRNSGDQVVFEVHDNGVGMSPAELENIFDPFFTTKPVGIGTGLGLSICHGIVTTYGGKIEVESVAGKGSKFRVWLPASKTKPRDASIAPAQVSPRGRVLVLDDDLSFLRAMKRMLSRDHDVETASDARATLARLEAGEKFDAIICDLMMPDMTGMEFHEQLSKTSPECAAGIVFVTGGTFTAGAQEFLDRVPNVRFNKPFEPAQIRAVLGDRLRAANPVG